MHSFKKEGGGNYENSISDLSLEQITMARINYLSTNYPELLTNWTNAINKVIIYKASTPYMWNKLKIEHHSGLSTFIIDDITKATTKGYDQLQWWTDVANKLFIK